MSEWLRREVQGGLFLPQDEDLANAFRSTALAPRTIVELAKRLDNVHSLPHIFIPEGSHGGFTSFDICSVCLAVSKRLRIGSGVIRVLEYGHILRTWRRRDFQDWQG
jgi:hypothetical protein